MLIENLDNLLVDIWYCTRTLNAIGILIMLLQASQSSPLFATRALPFYNHP
jgi:hypothetical protein